MFMENYYKTRTGAAGFVEEQIAYLKPDCVLTTIIRRGKSGDYSVTSAIGELSEDIEALHSLKQPTNT